MSMRIVSTVHCDRTSCTAEHEGSRPDATAVGWSCDSPRGLDHCPQHAADGPKYRPRGVCAFCGGTFSVSRSGWPTAHTTDLLTRCPGSYLDARPLPGATA